MKTINKKIKTMTSILIATILLTTVAAIPVQNAQAIPTTITLISGNGSVGNTDSDITMFVGPVSAPFGSAFVAQDFTDAINGGSPNILNPHPAYKATLDNDATAKYISTSIDPTLDGSTALFAQPFEVDCVAGVASADLLLDLHVDNNLGDSINEGLFINGNPVSGSELTPLGDIQAYFQADQQVGTFDITSDLQQGTNHLFVNMADVPGSSTNPAAIQYSATINYECETIIDLGEQCSDGDEICKSAIAIDANDTGYIEIGELIEFVQEIKVTNPADDAVAWQNGVVTDNFGAEIQGITCDDIGTDDSNVAIGTKNGKSEKHFVTWDFEVDLADGDMRSLLCDSETGVDDDGNQLYTACGEHEYNSGAVLKAEIPKPNGKKLQQISFSTDSIITDVFTIGKIGDCDGDGTPDSSDANPFTFDDADGDGVGDGDDVCAGFDDAIDDDGDGIPAGCDGNDALFDDADGDGVGDGNDVCPGLDDTIDGDLDGVPFGCDPDDTDDTNP